MVKIMLCNTNRSGPSQDVVVRLAEKLRMDVVMITEPSIGRFGSVSAPGWEKIASRTAAILAKEIKFKIIDLQSENTVAIDSNGVIIACTYLSPNKPFSSEIRDVCKLINSTQKLIIAGDFNCRLKGISSLPARERDKDFEEFLNTYPMKIENNKTPTCTHQGRLTVHDLVLTKKIHIKNFSVLTDEDILSDHIPITFETELEIHKRKKIYKKLNVNKLTDIISMGSPEIRPSKDAVELEQNAELITRYLQDIMEMSTEVKEIKKTVIGGRRN